MLPQTLVQNTIICEEKDNTLQLKWDNAAPIVDANFFHIDNLIKESGKYKKLLRPWELYTGTEVSPDLGLHQYYIATSPKSTYDIDVGDWVGRVRKVSQSCLDDCLVLAQSAKYYIYNSTTKKFDLNAERFKPCIVRPPAWGLTTTLSIPLTAAQLNNQVWQYNCTGNNLRLMLLNSDGTPLAFENDAIMARIFIKEDGSENKQLIAHVPVTILRNWNSQTKNYEFSLQFPDCNFPPNAEVEFW